MKIRNCIILSLFCLAFTSCFLRTNAKPIATTLEEIDRCIAEGNSAKALKLLKGARISSAMDAIGIYKRYIKISERKSAEKFLEKALKKYPKDLELNAVYVSFLKNDGLFDNAFSKSKILKGTKYGSLYSELYLRSLLEKNAELPFEFYLSDEMEEIYHEAYSTSLDNAWLRNVVLAHLANGKYADAADLAPEDKKNESDAYFWAQVFYDAARYDYAAQSLSDAEKFKEKTKATSSKGIKENASVSEIEIAALLSDCYVNMGEYDAAEAVRSNLIAQITLGSDEGHSDLLAATYLNSALYAQEHDDRKATYRQLSFVVEQWPDYVPALIAYGNFAYESARRVMDDPLTKALRDAGVVSAEMRRFDEMPRIPVSDAQQRMKESLERTNDPTLFVAALDLENKVDKRTDERVRLSKVWHLLEQNTIGTNLYPPEIMQYSVYTLLSLEEYDDAKKLFLKYLNARFEFDPEKPFEEELIRLAPKMHFWEVEYAAYFAAAENDALLSRRLYEYALYETGLSSSRKGNEISPESSVQSAVNLAMIYSSTGNKDKAMELYGNSSGRAMDSYLRSEIMYRLGCIYKAKENYEDALHSLEYSLYLNPSNGRARLLFNTMQD